MTVEGNRHPLVAARHFTLRTAVRPLRFAATQDDERLAAGGSRKFELSTFARHTAIPLSGGR